MLRMERLGEIIQGVLSPRIDEAQINVYPIVQSDLPENSTNKDVNYERTGGMEAQKYLRESCCHRIECFVANFLAALMRK